MSDPHFFVERLSPNDRRVVLSPTDSRHALRSLRLRPGEAVTVADGRGGVGRGRLVGADSGSDDRAVIEVDEVTLVVRPGTLVSVGLAPPKGDRLWWAVQKLAELGVDELVLFESERSVRTWEGERASKGPARARAVAREAAMQSRRPFLMEIAGPMPFEDALQAGPGLVVVLSEGASEPFPATLPSEAASVRLLVGPEGGFSHRDLDAVRRSGAAVASLGEGILRTETAAVAAAAIALSRLGRLG